MIGREEHELHKRRKGRNVALFVVLFGFVALLLAQTRTEIRRRRARALAMLATRG